MKNFTMIPNDLLTNNEKYGITSVYEKMFLINILHHKNNWFIDDNDMSNVLLCSTKTIQRTRKSLIEKNIIKVTSKKKVGSQGTFISGFQYTIYIRHEAEEQNSKYKELASFIKSKITSFFDNIDTIAASLINEIDPSFYEFKDYTPSDKEIEEFLKSNTKDIFDIYDKYLYNGIISESLLFNGKLIKPRLALFNSNEIRLKELLTLYYENKNEESMDNDKRDSLFDKAPSFEDFVKTQDDNIKKEVLEEQEGVDEEIDDDFIESIKLVDTKEEEYIDEICEEMLEEG